MGLKENVILGHLIPAGTGFRVFQEAEVKYRREALEELAGAAVQSLEESFPLLEDGAEVGAPAEGQPASMMGDPSAMSDPLPPMETSEPKAIEPSISEPPAASDQTEPPSSSDALDSMFGGGQD